MKFTSIKDLRKILLYLAKRKKQGELIQAWQNQGNKRIISDLLIDDIYSQQSIIGLGQIKDSDLFYFTKNFSTCHDFHKDYHLYAKGKDDTWAFSSPIDFTIHDRVFVNYPEELLLMEKRQAKRYDLSNLDELEMVLSLRLGVARRPLKVLLKDLSITGARLNITNKLLPYFYPGEKFMIHRLGNTSFQENLQAQVIRRIGHGLKGNQKGKIEFGVQFDSPLTEEIILSNIEKIQKNVA